MTSGLGFNRAVKPLPRLRLLSCSKCCWKRGRAIQLPPLSHSDDLVVAEHEMLSSTSRCCSCPILQVGTLGTGPLGRVVKPQMDVPGDGFGGIFWSDMALAVVIQGRLQKYGSGVPFPGYLR